MLKNLSTLLLIFSSFVFRVHAQFGTNSVIPPGPEAAALSRYADVPVSYYSGKPAIDIPLYTLKSGDISVPLSISYYTSGVKVEDPSTCLGMGWVINSGGVISRSIRGSSDGVGYNAYAGLPISSSTTVADYITISNLAATPYPSIEPDIFYYNFAGYSGSFYIKGDKVLLKKAADIKIEPIVVNLNIQGFIVTIQNGNRYYFQLGSSSAGAIDTTEWFLTKIEDFNNTHTINFEYNHDGNVFIVPPKNSKFYYFFGQSPIPHQIFNTPGVMWHNDNTGPVISKIYTSEHDSISFTFKNLVYDEVVSGTHTALDKMFVYNSKKEKVKAFKFVSNNIKTLKPYSTVGNGYPLVNSENSVNYRLYLDGLSELGENGTEIKHRFEYFGRSTNNQDSLPSRLSLGQDMGGFYNGIDTNQTLIPTYYDALNPMIVDVGTVGSPSAVDPSYPYDVVYIPGANRQIDFNYLKMGTLKSIQYPTGGKTEFYFSQQVFPATGQPYWGLKIDMIKYLDQNNNLLRKKRYEYSDGTSGHNIPPFLTYTHYSPDLGSISMFPGLLVSGIGSPYYQTYKTAVEVTPSGREDFGLFEGPTVGYGTVHEIEDGIGITTYRYQNESGSNETLTHTVKTINDSGLWGQLGLGDFWPLGPFPQETWKRGTLLSKKIHDTNSNVIQSSDYHYSFQVTDTIPAIKVLTVVKDGYYFFYEYNNFSTYLKLDSVTENNRGVITHIGYEYNNPIYRQKTKETRVSSSNHVKSTQYLYPYDFSGEPYLSMTTKYNIAPVIEEKISYDGVLRSTLKTSYDFFNSNTIIKPSQIQNQLYGRPLESMVNFNGYDAKGNLTSVSKPGGNNTVYVYGYNGGYPILQVQNVTYSALQGALGGSSIITQVLNSSPDKATIDGLVSALRNALPNSKILSYVYKPLVGFLSTTDAKGLTTYFEYDEFQRLMNTKDQNGNIIKSLDYHYKQF